MPSLENFHGNFNCVTSHVKVLGWLHAKKEETEKKKLKKGKKMNNSGFQPFQVGHFRILSGNC